MRKIRPTLRQLQVFESVADELSFTRASEKLHLSQPAVSIQVKQLEEGVGHRCHDLVEVHAGAADPPRRFGGPGENRFRNERAGIENQVRRLQRFHAFDGNQIGVAGAGTAEDDGVAGGAHGYNFSLSSFDENRVPEIIQTGLWASNRRLHGMALLRLTWS